MIKHHTSISAFSRGFSFVEVQITVAVLALLVAIVIPSVPRLAGEAAGQATASEHSEEKTNATADAIQRFDQAVLAKPSSRVVR